MSWSEIALICVSVVLVLVVICWIASANRKKRVGTDEISKTYVKNGVKYTKNDIAVKEDGSLNVTLKETDVVLEMGKKYTCKKKNGIMPGKYTVLSADENSKKFNIRVGKLVREYKHLSSIVLAEGDEVSAVSQTVILR